MSAKCIYDPIVYTATNAFDAGTKITMPAFETGPVARNRMVTFLCENLGAEDACLVPRDPVPRSLNPEDYMLRIPSGAGVVTYGDWATDRGMDWHVMRVSTAAADTTVRISIVTSTDTAAR